MRKQLVDHLIGQGVLQNPAVRDAFVRIDRREFVPEQYASEAYEDHPLPIGHGQTISQPYTVAYMLDALDPQPGQRILDIGSGSGWTTALLASIVAKGENAAGKVLAIEIIPALCEMGARNCEKYGFVSRGIAEFFCQDGNTGLAQQAPFDRILASAAAQENDIPRAWREQTGIGGRIVAPVLDSIVVFDKIGADAWKTNRYRGFSFVPLVSEE